MDRNSDTDWEAMLCQRDINQKWLERHICDLDYPALYLGDEMNTFHFDWDQAVKERRIDDVWRIVFMNMTASQFTFAAPAVMLFYEQLHAFDPSWAVERTLCPPTGYDRTLMEKDGIRPFAVESKMPLECFDVICMSIDMTDSLVSIPWMLMAGGIPLHAKERGEDDPFVILGGSALVNPGPLSPFCDIMLFGEGEDVLPQLLAMLEKGKKQGLGREAILLSAAREWDCAFVPVFYEERFDADGRFAGTFPLRTDAPCRIRFHRVSDLDKVFISKRPFLNFCNYAPDTSHYEISRGCEGKCSFCMPGFTSLPFRARSADLVRQTTESIIYETGNTFVTPVSFNSVSHPQVNRIVRDLSYTLGDKIKLVSLRMDGFSANPELCCFISMQKRGRVVFGVEGASQRLRDMISKNLTEEQILNTMREVCHYSYRTVKFMMICNMPGETDADLDELYDLAVKIRHIFEQETPPGRKLPRLTITWTVLKCYPHTPLQWARISQSLNPYYSTFTEKILGLGFTTYVPEIAPDDTLTQLFTRGDVRLAGLLEYLANEGDLKHDMMYGQEVLDKAIRYLDHNHLPDLDEWFREYRWEDPLPWDIVESPASKQYLYDRYLTVRQEQPSSVPVCTDRCSGCGACNDYELRRLKAMPAQREADRRIDLHHPMRKQAVTPVQHVLLEFGYDSMHSVVIPSYWDCEIRRALFHAGVLFDPDSVSAVGSREYDSHIASGFSSTGISLGKRYDTDELKQLIEEHAVNFYVRSVTETDRPVRVTSVTYRMKLPAGRDTEQLQAYLKTRLEESEWPVRKTFKYSDFSFSINLRPAVQSLDIEDEMLLITTGPIFTDPASVYRYLFDIPADQPLGQIPERSAVTYENQGALDLALTRETREAYLRYMKEKDAGGSDTDLAEMEKYISGGVCTNDINRLIRREYNTRTEFTLSEYLPGLIKFAMDSMRDPASGDIACNDAGDRHTDSFADDPALQELIVFYGKI